MDSRFQQGTLTTWNDDRGFGFIQPERGSRAVFLHISALKRASRRPRVGDTILYQQGTASDGKLRAETASIQGAAIPRHRASSRQSSGRSLVDVAVRLGGLAMLGFAAIEYGHPHLSSLLASTAQSDCSIKGNISISSGKKLYHLPGMEDYASTNIEPVHGERWFCTEAEAIANGWQKAPR
ncbi:MAG: cold shock domain-containing protein [Phormidesmis sp.]